MCLRHTLEIWQRQMAPEMAQETDRMARRDLQTGPGRSAKTTQGRKADTAFRIVHGSGKLRLFVPVDVEVRRYLAGSFGAELGRLSRAD
jgi:hypothetical protein